MSDRELYVGEAAWNAVHDATPAGWQVGRPYYHVERRQWVQYAFDPSERPKVGLRSREWTAVGESKEAVVRDGALPEGDQGGTGAAVGSLAALLAAYAAVRPSERPC